MSNVVIQFPTLVLRRVLSVLLALFAIASALLAGGTAQAQSTVPMTVVTVQVPVSLQNPSGLETQLVQIPDSGKLKINPDNMPTTPPATVVINGNAPIKVNTATGWGASTDPYYNGKSGAPVCGGYWNGKLQDKCPASPAIFVAEAVGTCPQGSFVDLGAGGCFTCPPGFNRTGDAVTSDTACSKADASVQIAHKSATLAGSLCPAGGFFDIIRGGECYTCPEGYRRSAAHIDAPNACFIPGGERFARANRTQRTIWPHECRSGSFHDAWDGGGCWTCPAGFRRTGNHIADANACVQNFSEQQARATPRGKAECKAGEFFDPRNGGECWTCPSGTYRTVFPVTGAQACEQRAGVQLTKSTQVSNFSCPAGSILDLISSREPIVRSRIEKQIAETGKRIAYGNSAGGTCWQCPPGYIRDIYHVAGNAACKTDSIKWKPAPYVQPGFFGLDGANEVAQAVLTDGRELETFIAAAARDSGMPLEQLRKDIYAEVSRTPQSSPLLAVAVYKRIEAAVRNPAQATPAEKRLVASLAEAIRQYRVFMAQNALDMYDQWSDALMRQAANDAEKAGAGSIEQQRLNQLAFKGGDIPPDFKEIAAELTVFNVTAPAAMQAFLTSTTALPTLRKAIFPSISKTRTLARYGAKEIGEEIVEKTAQQVVKKVSEKMASQATSRVVSLAIKAGPQLVADLMIEAVVVVAEHYAVVLNARPALVTNLAGAKQPVDMLRELNADEGWLFNEWAASLGSGDWPPANQGVFSKIAAASAAKASTATLAPNVWLQMPGAAIDIGMGAGTLWAIGNNAVQGGFGVFRWDGKSWVDMKGGAVRLDVDAKGYPWVVTDKGEIYNHNGRTWTLVAGAAKDIGVGANGSAWVIGTAATEGGFEIYRMVNGNWQRVPGGGVRIDVDPQGNAWVISNGGDVFRYTGSGWAAAPGVKAQDIGIGADGSVFIVARDGGVHRWSGQAWVKRDGRLTAVTADARGVPFGISDNNQIWMGYP